MQTWPVADAKAKFNALLDACLSDGPQLLIERGDEVAVLVSAQEWRRLQSEVCPSLKQLLLSNSGRVELSIPKRGQANCRSVEPI